MRITALASLLAMILSLGCTSGGTEEENAAERSVEAALQERIEYYVSEGRAEPERYVFEDYEFRPANSAELPTYVVAVSVTAPNRYGALEKERRYFEFQLPPGAVDSLDPFAWKLNLNRSF